jgi:hypothetical protein
MTYAPYVTQDRKEGPHMGSRPLRQGALVLSPQARFSAGAALKVLRPALEAAGIGVIDGRRKGRRNGGGWVRFNWLELLRPELHFILKWG